MDFDELGECDVMFWDYSADYRADSSSNDENDELGKRSHCGSGSGSGSRMAKILKRRKNSVGKIVQTRTNASSEAIDIIPTRNNSFRYQVGDVSEDKEDYSQFRLPPHLIVERRVSEELARSFSPLKGRNLCHFRNSVLRITGFLES